VRAQRAVSRAGKWSWEDGKVINLVVLRPDVKQRVQKELDDAKRKGLLSPPFPTYDECVALPYLQATAIESMRLHPSTSAVLERVVHRGGPELEGFYLPARAAKVGYNPGLATVTKRCTDPMSGASIQIDFSAAALRRGEKWRS
jgi:hypothetical protein